MKNAVAFVMKTAENAEQINSFAEKTRHSSREDGTEFVKFTLPWSPLDHQILGNMAKRAFIDWGLQVAFDEVQAKKLKKEPYTRDFFGLK